MEIYENSNIFVRYILGSFYSILCGYIAVNSFVSALGSFIRIKTEDTLDNLLKTALYVMVTQLSIVTARAFCNMLSLNLINIDAVDMITNLFKFCFPLGALYMVLISALELPEEFSVLEYIKTVGFKIVFSLIFLNVVIPLMMYLSNGIYALQVLIYEMILEVNPWYKEVLILMFSLVTLNWIFQCNRIIPVLLKKMQTENNDLDQ